MDTACRTAATWLAVIGLGLGFIRAASTDVAARAAHAREHLAGAAAAAGVIVQADREPTPTVALAALVGVHPGASAPFKAPGRYTPGSTASMARGPFTLSNAAVTATSLTGTVSAAGGSLPAVGRLEVATPRGSARAVADAVFVAGRWNFALKAANGWRVEIVTDLVTAQNATSGLPVTVRFFKGTDAAPFETRKGTLSGDGSGTSATVSLNENMPGGSAECDRVTARYQQIAQDLGKGPSEKLMAEFERLTEKYAACMEQQQKAIMDQVQKAQDPAFQAAEKLRRDNFGCGYVRVQSAADGSVTGQATCGSNVGQLALTGTVTHAAQ